MLLWNTYSIFHKAEFVFHYRDHSRNLDFRKFYPEANFSQRPNLALPSPAHLHSYQAVVMLYSDMVVLYSTVL